MNLHFSKIIVYLRYLAFFIVVYTIVVQTVTETFEIFNHDVHEFTDFNGEDDRNEQENQEKDSKNDKIEFYAINDSYHYYPKNLEYLGYFNPKLLWNFCQEIPIPPPEWL